MRFRRSHPERHIDALARTAQLEMSLGMGTWQDTLSQMHELINQLDDQRKAHRSAEDLLIDQLRRRLAHLEAVIHHREEEYDQLQERFCALKDRVNQGL